MSRAALACFGALLALTLAAPAHATDVPYLTGRVVDNASILSEAERTHLDDVLKQHEQATTNQIVVLTVPTTGDDSIEEYANNVFHAWKLGQKGKDNGVLVVIAPRDHKMRIEVGYGLEPTLTDGACGEIIRTWMTPRFKSGDYDKGVDEGVAAIVARLNGQAPPAAPPQNVSNGFNAAPMPLLQRILMGLFIFGIIGVFTIVGVMTPGMGWFLYLFLIPFWAMFPIVIIGGHATFVVLMTYLIGYPIAKLLVRQTDSYKKAVRDMKTKGYGSIGGFAFSSGSGGGGFSSGGGGFSGGGGDSGGGGASGSW